MRLASNAACRISGGQILGQAATLPIAALARAEGIYKTQKFSDHTSITVDYEFKL